MIDSHCHINDPAFQKDPENYIKIAKDVGIAEFLVVGYDLKSSISAVEIANTYPECFAAVGVHPSDVKRMGPNDLVKIEELLTNKKVIAIGEIGLDYYWDKDKETQDQQKEFFIKQIEIANKHNLPISIHCRDAYEDCYKILKEHHVNRGGIMHCYGGSKEMAPLFVKLGFVIGLGGTVTFKNAVRPKEVAKTIGSTDYVLETDAPYLAPHPFRGQQNHSKYLYLVRDEIANLRNTSKEQVDQESTANFNRIFK